MHPSGFPAVVEAIRGFLEDQPTAEAEDITEELGYAGVTVKAGSWKGLRTDVRRATVS
jgi:hypothetical protein